MSGISECQALAREYSVVAIKALDALVRHSDDDKVVIMAAKEILDRAWGKATESREVSGPGGSPVGVTVHQVAFGPPGPEPVVVTSAKELYDL